MSLSTTTEEIYLPNLPGYRSHKLPIGAKRKLFSVINGMPYSKENDELFTNQINDDLSQTSTSIVSNTTSLTLKPKIPVKVENVNLILTFFAYFEDKGSYNTFDSNDIRKCVIYYYTENSTIAIVEKSQQNSGVPQGTLLKRSTIYRRDGSYITPDELIPGQSIDIYSRIYHIVDCDLYTKKYLKYEYDINDIQSYPIPEDRHTNYRKTLEKGPSDEWNKYRSKKNQNTIYIEAILGNSVNNKSREGFLKYGNQKLRFKCVWDNRDNLYGERSEYSMIYHLSDDTVEIFSSVSIASSMNSGREPFIRLLKRSKLPKVSVDELATGSLSFSAPVGVGNNDSNNNYYTWKDLNIGIEIIVYARTLHIIDADTPTREFYHSQGYELDPGVVIPEEVVNVKQREIPPYNGFGSEEDSLRSCTGSLLVTSNVTHVLNNQQIKKYLDNKILNFNMILLSNNVDDQNRKFILTYYVQDNTLKVIEPPIRNSGFVGGTFLSRRQIKNTDNASFISENDLYIGNTLNILNSKFLLTSCSESTLHWLEEQKLPKANFFSVIGKIRNVLINDINNNTFINHCIKYDKINNSNKITNRITKNDLIKILDQNYSLIGNESNQLCEHEVLTIVRFDGNKSIDFDYNKVIEQIKSPNARDYE